jgi:iron(III) transport system ATP-binding protein
MSMKVAEMEFLGSFWRARLENEALGDIQIIADFSINAIRRIDISEGSEIEIEMPSKRLKVFPLPADVS